MFQAIANGTIPVIEATGGAYDAGYQLGGMWADTLRLEAQGRAAGSSPWWMERVNGRLVEKIAPHLPELFKGMAHGAGVPEGMIGARARPAEVEGCTSWALTGQRTETGEPMSGQTKDVPLARALRFQVLKLKLKGAPGALSLTYPGWVFGHGFVTGGCAIFRNSIWSEPGTRGLAYSVWGLLALHCKDVEEVARLTRDHGVRETFHNCVTDTKGGILGIECTGAGVAFLRARDGAYTHANCLLGDDSAMRNAETENVHFKRADSEMRTLRSRTLLSQGGKVSVGDAWKMMGDHEGWPVGICRHQNGEASTGAAVIVEPTLGRLHAARGHPCTFSPVTHVLD